MPASEAPSTLVASSAPPADVLPTGATWSRELKDVVRDTAELLRVLALDPEDILVDAKASFPLRVPRAFVARMRQGDPADPLLRQVLPLAMERAVVAGFSADPLGERTAMVTPALMQKYAGRMLLIAAADCAVHCRYCFRRNFPYSEHRLRVDDESLRAIADDESISEVIASGGDPLMLTDAHFSRLLDALEAIPHLRRLRIHTRLPVVIPSRVTSQLVRRLRDSRLGVVVVLHVNHANEIDADVAAGAANLGAAGISVLNQSVLLRGVNDDAEALIELSQRLFEAGVLPYYLHLLDPVAGAHHMLVDDARARALYAELRARLPGYLVPRLARETPGQPAKDWLLG